MFDIKINCINTQVFPDKKLVGCPGFVSRRGCETWVIVAAATQVRETEKEEKRQDEGEL